MTEKKPDDLARLYANIVVELGARPDMSLEEVRDVFDHWGDVTREPGGVDYSEDEANGDEGEAPEAADGAEG